MPAVLAAYQAIGEEIISGRQANIDFAQFGLKPRYLAPVVSTSKTGISRKFEIRSPYVRVSDPPPAAPTESGAFTRTLTPLFVASPLPCVHALDRGDTWRHLPGMRPDPRPPSSACFLEKSLAKPETLAIFSCQVRRAPSGREQDYQCKAVSGPNSDARTVSTRVQWLRRLSKNCTRLGL